MDTIQSAMENTAILGMYKSILEQWKKRNMEAENTTFECREELEECLETTTVDFGTFIPHLYAPIDRVVQSLITEMEGMTALKDELSKLAKK